MANLKWSGKGSEAYPALQSGLGYKTWSKGIETATVIQVNGYVLTHVFPEEIKP
jgi:hypothetical protein